MMCALGWLVWGAGTAQAALPAPDTGAILQQAASSPLVEPVPLPAPPVIADGGDATAPAPVSPVAGLSDAPVAAADPVLTGTTDAVSGLAPAVPLVEQLLPVPLPEVLPLPDVLPLPNLLPDLITLPTPAPGPVPAAPRVIPASSGVPDPGDSVLLSAAEPGEVTVGAATAATPQAFDGGAANIRTFGFSPAQDRAGSPAVPGVTAMPSGAPRPPDPLRVSVLAGQAGSAGPTSPGGLGGAADIAGSWPELPATTGAINRPGAETLPAGPSFDPGSSPD